MSEQLPASQEMIRGYLDGLSDDRLSLHESSNYSQQYLHGWLNGRDDRTNKPRNSCQALADEAKKLIEGDL